eukprot:3592562-Pyramimonas_sp.AAC.1
MRAVPLGGAPYGDTKRYTGWSKTHRVCGTHAGGPTGGSGGAREALYWMGENVNLGWVSGTHAGGGTGAL